MKIVRKIQADFYRLHLEEMVRKYDEYLASNALSMCKTGQLHVGKFVGIDEKRGTILVRFKKELSPRRKMLYTCFTLPPPLSSPKNWGAKRYFDLRNNAVNKLVSDASSVYFMPYHQNEEWLIVGFSQVDLNLVKVLKPGVLFILAQHEPPGKYLQILTNMTNTLPPNPVLDIETSSNTWKPYIITPKENPLPLVLKTLEEEDEVIIQGPPGTGKTFLVSQICSAFLQKNKSVIVTALTNRALIEVADKRENLEYYLNQEKVSKTSLSNSEKKEIPELQRANEILPSNEHLILSTYYKLSEIAAQYPQSPIFDVLIIEEASQAYLSTIAIFKILARKVIIVGDPLQLPPIWNKGLVSHLHKNIAAVGNGLETYAYNSNITSFQLSATYRLPKKAAQQTGLFYNNSLVSVYLQLPPFEIAIPKKIKKFLSPEGGTSLFFMNLFEGGKKPLNAINFINDLVSDFLLLNPKKSLAVLSPFRATNKALQSRIYPQFGNNENLMIETIDRIQGLTTDFTIYLIPFDSFQFSFDLNRFNVATSRSRTHTLIILDETFRKLSVQSRVVQEFLELCYRIVEVK